MEIEKGVRYVFDKALKTWTPKYTEEQMETQKALAVLEKQNEEFDPTIRTEPDELVRAYNAAREIVQARSKLSKEAKDFATAIMPETEKAARVARKAMLRLRRAINLRTKFGWKIVKIDSEAKRRAKTGGGTFDVPLVWRTRIPAPPKVTISVNGYNISTKTPPPTARAEEMIAKHKHRFDWLECAWVPKDANLFAVPIPRPDPVLIGALDLGNGKAIYVELERWVDESVESQWWAKEIM